MSQEPEMQRVTHIGMLTDGGVTLQEFLAVNGTIGLSDTLDSNARSVFEVFKCSEELLRKRFQGLLLECL